MYLHVQVGLEFQEVQDFKFLHVVDFECLDFVYNLS